jgi:hypothetical protein
MPYLLADILANWNLLTVNEKYRYNDLKAPHYAITLSFQVIIAVAVGFTPTCNLFAHLSGILLGFAWQPHSH